MYGHNIFLLAEGHFFGSLNTRQTYRINITCTCKICDFEWSVEIGYNHIKQIFSVWCRNPLSDHSNWPPQIQLLGEN